MPEIERFLEPIPGDNPAGAYLRYNPLYGKIEEARRREDPAVFAKLNLGRDAKAPDYKQVIQLSEEALTKQTKDLQIAAWLTEAWASRDRLAGLTSGLRLLKSLLEQFWAHAYPEIDEGDAGLRAMPLEWVGSSFDCTFAVRSIPLTKNARDTWLVYQESRSIGYESEIKGNASRVAARQQALSEGKVSPEDFDKDFDETPKTFYKAIAGDCAQSLEAIEELDRLCVEKFGNDAPSFTTLRKALEEVSNVIHILLLKKLEKEPDPVEPVNDLTPGGEAAVEPLPNGVAAPVYATVAAAQFDFSQLVGEIKSIDEAVLHVVAAAQFLRQKSPANPASYLLLRALRWSEVRAANESAMADLPAPPSEVRVTLKMAASGKNWKRVLEVAENAMGSPIGRGWLDLQRYSIRACDELGFADAAKALRSELRAFLKDFPQLSTATLNDDTGTANPETLVWLQQEGLLS